MTTTDATPGTMTGKPLIESDRVEGTTVYGPNGENIGRIKRLMIEKLSGRVAYACRLVASSAWETKNTPSPGMHCITTQAGRIPHKLH